MDPLKFFGVRFETPRTLRDVGESKRKGADAKIAEIRVSVVLFDLTSLKYSSGSGRVRDEARQDSFSRNV